MPYANVDIFRKKGTKSFSKKVWETLNFMKKWQTFLLSFNSKLSHFNKNLNLKSQMVFTKLGKTDMVLIYGEARGHSELARQIYGEMFPQSIGTSQCKNLCKFCAASLRFRAFKNE
jgi:hypothetical protein